MKKTVKKFLCIILVMTLALSGIPGMFSPVAKAYAEGNAASSSAGSLRQVEFTRTSNGTSFIFMGSDPVLLSSIFRLTGLKDKTSAEGPTFDPSDGFTVTQSGTDWQISYSGDPSADGWTRTMTVKVGSTTHTYQLRFAAVSGGTWVNKESKTMTWAYDGSTKTLTLSGAGTLNKDGQDDDFGLDKTMGGESTWIPEVPWKAWINDIKKVVIEEGITSIGDQAFRKHTALATVEIKGYTLTKLGKCSFMRCTNLTTLDLTGCTSLTDIGQNATANEAPFLNSGLTTVLLSPAIVSLPKKLFNWSNSNVSSVNLSQLINLENIQENAFKKEDTSAAITDSEVAGGLNLNKQTKLVTIGQNAFRNQTGLNKNLVIGSSVLTTIDEGAFSAWKADYGVLESVDLSACTSLKTIGKETFLYQTKLTSIQFPDAFTWIDKDAFNNCSGLNLPAATIAYCVGGNGALYNVNADGTATRILNDGDDTLSWIPTAIAAELPYTNAEQALVNGPTLCPEIGSYSITYTLNGSSVSGIPNAKDPGTYEVGYTVTLPEGTTTKTGTISVTIAQPTAITVSMLSLDQASFEYDGNSHTPVLTVKDGTTDLIKDTDYTVSGDTSKTDVGSYTISVTGKGSYAGTASISWTIVDTTAPAISGVTNGSEYTADVSFTVTDLLLDSVTLQKDSETPQSLTVSSGSASGTASENGTYTIVAKDTSGNTTTLTFTIAIPEQISSAMLSLDQDSFEYDGGSHAPMLTVKDGTTDLIKDTDYTVSGDTNKTDVGSYTISVTGKGGYAGTASISWKIEDKTAPVVTGVTNGSEYTADVSFTVTDLLLDSVTLQKDSETPQSLTVSSGSASGTASENGTYTIVAKDTSGNTTTVTFTVAIPAQLTNGMLSLDKASFEYDGSSHTPVLTVNDGTADLVKDTDYTVDTTSVASAEDIGTYTISVTGKGGYTGTASISWEIKDTTAPVISGVTDGTTYTEAASFSVSDLLLSSVTLQKDSETPQSLTVSSGSASGTASENGTYTIVAKDTSGNTTTLTFTVAISEPEPEPGTDPEPPVAQQAETPVIDPAGGTFRGSVSVSISCATPGATIRYTTDGTDPDTANGTVYTSGSAITLTRSTTLKAIAIADGYTDSEISSAAFRKRSTRKKNEEEIPDDGPPLANPFPFKDVPEGTYYRKAVEWAWEKGVTGGTSPESFSPYAPANRAQAVTSLWAAAGKPEPTITENPFKDVSESDYFYKAVLWAYEKGITSGVSADEFGVSQNVSRAQFITFLYGAQGRPAAGSEPFDDVTASDYFQPSVAWAYEKGITSGTGEGRFSPDADCQRCQVVTFLYLTYGTE